MKRANLWSAVLVPAAFLAGCGSPGVDVTIEVDLLDPESGEMVARPAANLPVQLVPFDRDVVFDSLTRAASRPEPGFPMELQIMQDSLFAAQEEYRNAEAEWLAVRDRLQTISREMSQYSPAEGAYRVLFSEFSELEGRERNADRRRNTAFERAEALQRTVLGDLNEARILQEQWEDEAFANYGDVVATRLRDLRREIVSDTTDAMGQARIRPKQAGTWWVVARYRLPTEELYWNIRVDLDKGDPFPLRLTRANAEVRRAF
jgi:hypothetical protein